MQRGTKIALGAVVVAAGLGGGAYGISQVLRRQALAKRVSGLSVAVSPSSLNASGAQPVTVQVTWTNTTAGALTYGVQGVIVDEASGAGLVAGHLFSSQAVASQAHSASAAAAAQLVTSPADRVAGATAGAGASGSATLYGYIDPSALVGNIAVLVWVQPNPPSGALLVSDPAGKAPPSAPAAQGFEQAEGVA